MNQYIFILEIVGTIAFAISGALVSMKSKMDFFGVVIIGVITATFGGIMRDIVLGSVPPKCIFPIQCMLLSLVLLLLSYSYLPTSM